MNKNIDYLKWALFTMIDRKTQDDKKSKVNVIALFRYPLSAEKYAKNIDKKTYILDIERLDRFEQFYNHIQDINEKYSEKAIFHINDKDFSVDELNRFREMLNIRTDTLIEI